MKLSFALLAALLFGVVAAAPAPATECSPDELDIPTGASGVDGDVPGSAVDAMKKRCVGVDF
ncbi:hypothetical protein GSI_01252 [Ganoderma sinense ZZ0214-1]|uniref:Transporter n=1 Tax=Ganoderma sinense ZZ0214-1 TaxID=1077348 RepID=A0A2G8SVD9_9APHY|nr:hypothetical protein GSI_01252 [Ganoderma sinense ZZ0214-1]